MARLQPHSTRSRGLQSSRLRLRATGAVGNHVGLPVFGQLIVPTWAGTLVHDSAPLNHETRARLKVVFVCVRVQEGRTPLRWASHTGCTGVVRVLLTAGADKDGVDKVRWPAVGQQLVPAPVAPLLVKLGMQSLRLTKAPYGTSDVRLYAVGFLLDT